MPSVWRRQPTGRLEGPSLYKLRASGSAQLVADDYFEASGPTATFSATLGALVLAATAAAGISAAAAPALAAATVTATGAAQSAGSASVMLGLASLGAQGSVSLAGGLARSLDSVSLGAAGTAGDPPVDGGLDVALGALLLSGQGGTEVAGAAALTLGPLSGSAGAGAEVGGHAASGTLAALSLDASGLVTTNTWSYGRIVRLRNVRIRRR